MPMCLMYQDLSDIRGMYGTVFVCGKENPMKIINKLNFQFIMAESRLQTRQLLQEQLSYPPVVIYFGVCAFRVGDPFYFPHCFINQRNVVNPPF